MDVVIDNEVCREDKESARDDSDYQLNNAKAGLLAPPQNLSGVVCNQIMEPQVSGAGIFHAYASLYRKSRDSYPEIF
jgi:hypothetical protein